MTAQRNWEVATRKTYTVKIQSADGSIRSVEITGKNYRDAVENIGAHTVTSDKVLSCTVKEQK